MCATEPSGYTAGRGERELKGGSGGRAYQELIWFMYWPGREVGEAPAAPQLRLMLSRSCCCSACMRRRLSDVEHWLNFLLALLRSSRMHQPTQLLCTCHAFISDLPSDLTNIEEASRPSAQLILPHVLGGSGAVCWPLYIRSEPKSFQNQ